jgi:predicted DNA-binding transcriptional regulator YafY
MERLDRLERVTDLLLVLLDTPQPLSLREIANRIPGYPTGHEARRQAFERDKRLLRDEGVPLLVEPISGEEQLGYRVDPAHYYLPDLGLDPEEQGALNLAVAGVHLGDPSGADALSKLGATGESPLRPMVDTPLVDLPSVESLPALSGLFDAVRLSATVTFGYRGSPRRVDPAGLRFRGGHWYLIAFDRDRGEGRTFRVDRVSSTPSVGTPGSVELPEEFDTERAFSAEPWRFGAGDETAVDVLVDPVEAGRVVAELGSGAVIERRSSGAVVVRLSVTDMEALVTWVLGLLDLGEVLAPPGARAAVIARLEALIGAGDRATGATG